VNVRIESVRGLHAKAYALVMRVGGHDEMIIGSANFTSAGLSRNVELGVRVRGRLPVARALLDRGIGCLSSGNGTSFLS
jgi:phosphatidylserine/phosphatidylglycerophosphate/cardiolipin synthase-like enzyme